MRSLIMLAVAVAAAVVPFVPAASAIHRGVVPREPYVGSGGPGDGPFWSGEPGDHLPIWRFGYYQGNDPDPFIRGQIMRDPTNGPLA